MQYNIQSKDKLRKDQKSSAQHALNLVRYTVIGLTAEMKKVNKGTIQTITLRCNGSNKSMICTVISVIRILLKACFGQILVESK